MLSVNLLRDQKFCKACGKLKPHTEFYRCSGKFQSRDRLRYECKSCSMSKLVAWGKTNSGKVWKYQRNYRRDVREKVIEKYGARCADSKCLVPGGCTDIRALQLDHVNNDGARERYERGYKTNAGAIWKKALADTEGRYQLLCANCNTIKEYERSKKATEEKNRYRLTDAIVGD